MIPIIIPSYEPDEKIIQLLHNIKDANLTDPVIIIDDGSQGEMYQELFRRAEEEFGYTVLHHAVNQGKGRALKTAFNDCLLKYPDMVGCVTIDSDGQHSIKDMLSCMKALEEHPDSLIMGCRNFGEAGIPARSSFGNRTTRLVMKALTGVVVSDTQTGLRAIPREFMKKLLTEKGERYEFETNMLIDTKSMGVSIVEVPIDTIYIENNSSSHFDSIRDSARIYALFGKFIFSSGSSSVIDLALFALFFHFVKNVDLHIVDSYMLATVMARIISGVYNFAMNYKVVFQSDKNKAYAAISYLILAIFIMLASGFLVGRICTMTSLPTLLVKIVVDCLLFLVSFFVQREVVYR